jgi:hypothetical protein
MEVPMPRPQAKSTAIQAARNYWLRIQANELCGIDGEGLLSRFGDPGPVHLLWHTLQMYDIPIRTVPGLTELRLMKTVLQCGTRLVEHIDQGSDAALHELWRTATQLHDSPTWADLGITEGDFFIRCERRLYQLLELVHGGSRPDLARIILDLPGFDVAEWPFLLGEAEALGLVNATVRWIYDEYHWLQQADRDPGEASLRATELLRYLAVRQYRERWLGDPANQELDSPMEYVYRMLWHDIPYDNVRMLYQFWLDRASSTQS